MVAVAVCLILLPAILSSLFGVTCQDPGSSDRHLISQLHEAKLKVAQLESSLEEIIENGKARDRNLEECEKRIGEMDKRIHDLRSALSKIKGDSSHATEKIIALEQEVQILWATARKNNFDLHLLESKAQETEDRLEVVKSQVEKMADIVTERWIQVQQFEQALQLKEMKMSKAQRLVRHQRCTFLKFLNELSRLYLPNAPEMLDSHWFGKGSALRSYISKMLHELKRFYLTIKETHHELQGFVKREMERHEFTASLANEELVFFAASALMVFPVLIAWIFLSSQLAS